MGISSVNLKPQGTLHHVLYVSRLFLNLVSIQRLTKLDEYRIIFDDVDAFLLKKVHRWRIGLANIYIMVFTTCWMHTRAHEARQTTLRALLANSIVEERVTLLHRRLAHLSYTLLKLIHPNLLEKVSLNNLICEACQLVQLQRSSYLQEEN